MIADVRFFQDGYPSSYPTSSVKAVRESILHLEVIFVFFKQWWLITGLI